ncbi:MAG: ribulose-1,5-bisphosphate carboxylase/oxygenase large subunit [Phycisphaerae bacterium]|nr:MAG: ribulose-1,5-bisphosphate carboxylase/oxygenase large subunit [Phycisphaerae bacterium]
MSERLTATYYVETPLSLSDAAEILAGEQSSGTFVAVPGETEELKAAYAARVESVEELETVSEPSLPGSRSPVRPAHYTRGRITISWPVHNFGTNLPVLISTLQGNLYELAQFSGLKLMDFTPPAGFVRHFRGPAFGVEGTRLLTGVGSSRPIIGTIIKPSVGLSPEQTASVVKQLVEADIDFIKDDELQANSPHSPFDRRLEAVMRVINDHAQKTGKKVMYACNISDELDAMKRHYDRIVELEGTCAMISLNTVGMSAVKHICDRGELAIHGHRNGWGMLNRHPLLGIDFAAYQKLWRLAGVDQIHVNGIANKFWEPDDSVVASIKACRKKLGEQKSICPVISSGQTGLQAPETYRRVATTDLLYLAGGGIAAHPSGHAAGVAALRQAWEAAVAGISLDEYAKTHPELRQSMQKFKKSD